MNRSASSLFRRASRGHRGGCSLAGLWALLAGVTAAFLLFPSAALADAVADGKELFARGRQLRLAGDCADAVPVFRKAYDLYPAGLGSLRNIAECDESLGRFAAAKRSWLDLKHALAERDEPKYAGWRQDATEAANRLAERVATLIIDLRVAPATSDMASDVEVTLNGETLAPGLIGTPLERDPGRYVIRATGRRVQSASEVTIDLLANEHRRVPLPVVLTPEPIRALETSEIDRLRRPAAWAAIGIGTAALIGAGLSWAVRQSALDSLTRECGPMIGPKIQCEPSKMATVQPIQSSGQTATTIANVLVAVGIAGIAGGTVLLATAPSSPMQAALLVSPTAVSARGRF
jgi:hypothetical protein